MINVDGKELAMAAVHAYAHYLVEDVQGKILFDTDMERVRFCEAFVFTEETKLFVKKTLESMDELCPWMLWEILIDSDKKWRLTLPKDGNGLKQFVKDYSDTGIITMSFLGPRYPAFYKQKAPYYKSYITSDDKGVVELSDYEYNDFKTWLAYAKHYEVIE